MIEPGMLATSKAGHDKGAVYVIIDVKNEYIYLADGKTRTICQAKKKNRKHIQIICKKHNISAAKDADIRNILKRYKGRNEKCSMMREKHQAGGFKNVKS